VRAGKFSWNVVEQLFTAARRGEKNDRTQEKDRELHGVPSHGCFPKNLCSVSASDADVQLV
jgi:hypothetical protein